MRSGRTDGAAFSGPGMDQLLGILTAPPTQAELAGEQRALAMFRASAGPLASSFASPLISPKAGTAADGAVTAPIPARPPATQTPATQPPATQPRRAIRNPFRSPARWGMRLAAAGVLVVAGAMTVAAYAAVLPVPVQNLAHDVLSFAGVPPAHHQHGTGAPPGHGGPTAPGGHRGASPGGSARQSPNPGRLARPSASASPSGSPSPSVVTRGAVLSAAATSARIAAGTQPIIVGKLSRSGTGIAGVTVTLIERLAGHRVWRVAGTGQTSPSGSVALTGPPLATNAVFRLRVFGGVHSASVLVIVTPQITVVATRGASGLRDLLAVTTKYAQPGNVVWLQVESAAGGWQKLRYKELDATGKAWFVLSGTRLKNRMVRVLLVATVRHGRAASSSWTVPPPG